VFKEMMRAWSEHSFSSKIIKDFIYMLDSSEEMLDSAFKTLTDPSVTIDIENNIYRKDQSINFKERDIRKQILVHLSTNPSSNISAYLALISISKDAERLGDYIKNLFELKGYLSDTSDYNSQIFVKLFEEDGMRLKGLFKKVSVAFRNSDRVLAMEAVRVGREIGKKCEATIQATLKSDYSVREAVVLALGARYMKRIALHLANIASSIANPMADIDYISR
jgi:phosphate uptake regulator